LRSASTTAAAASAAPPLFTARSSARPTLMRRSALRDASPSAAGLGADGARAEPAGSGAEPADLPEPAGAAVSGASGASMSSLLGRATRAEVSRPTPSRTKCSLSTGVLPRLPRIFLRVGADRSPVLAPGFLGLARFEITLAAEGEAESEPFVYDMVTRRALDAVVILAHATPPGGPRHVWLRSAVRPPLALRPDDAHDANLWEAPAGLVEPGESPRAAAARELAEELGFHLPESALEPLGQWSWPLPALLGEQHHFFHVRVDGAAQEEAKGDGHPLERHASLVAVPLDDALGACRSGALRDEKTELALRRLAEIP